MSVSDPIASRRGTLAVITGASRGIGAEVIRVFAAGGYNIATYSRKESSLLELREEVVGRFGIQFHHLVADAAIREEVDAFGDFVQSLGQPVRVLVNNAGNFVPGAVLDEPETAFADQVAVNLESAYRITRKLAPAMKAARFGHIFNMCSVASIKAYPAGGTYAITKTALLGFSRNLREELREFGVRVTTVMPGATYTESWAGAGLPEERFIPVEDLARLIWACHDVSPRTCVEELLVRPQPGDI
ncbi:MAG: SDR family oxidoreductase [Bacteroidota bacterium]